MALCPHPGPNRSRDRPFLLAGVTLPVEGIFGPGAREDRANCYVPIRPSIFAPNFLLKIIPHVDGRRAFASWSSTILQGIVIKGAGTFSVSGFLF